MEDTYTISKNLVECYKIRQLAGLNWADITIDVNGEGAGRISISSDYGNFANYWCNCGPFKKFLTQIDMHYAAGKFGMGNWFDFEKTIGMYKTLITDAFRSDSIDVDKAEILYAEVNRIQNETSDSLIELHSAVTDSEILTEFFCHDYPDMCYSVNPMFVSFWNIIWPVFINEIKKELSDGK